MKITLEAPDGLKVMFIGYVAYDKDMNMFASNHAAKNSEMKDGGVIKLKDGLEDGEWEEDV